MPSLPPILRRGALLAALLAAACAPTAPRPALSTSPRRDPTAPVPAFADPARRAKLAAAFPGIDERLGALAAASRAPGLAVGIVVDGELAWAKGYGVRDLATRAAVTPATVFRIYSVTKTITATAVLQLRDAGRLSLDDAAETYLPELASLRYPPDAPRIRIRDLLAHEAGLPHFTPARPADEMHGYTEAELLAGLRDMPLVRAPGVEFQYSSLGYAILGAIVARVGGMPYRRYVTDHILRPLGMTSTTFEPETIRADRLAVGYDDTGKPDAPAPFGADAPEGALFSSVEDLARYAALELSAWPPRGGPDSPVLRRSSVREMHTAAGSRGLHVRRTGDGELRASAQAIGLSWALLDTCDLDRIVTHNGGDAGYHAAVYALPEYGVAVVTLANGGSGNDDPAREVLASLVKSGGLAKRVLAPTPSMVAARDGVSALLDRWDDAQARSVLGLRAVSAPRETFAALRRDHGACRPDGDAEMGAPGHLRWRLACERGALQLDGELMTARAGFDGLDVTEIFPPSEPMAAATRALVGLLGRWDDAVAGATFATRAAADAFARGATRTGPCDVQHTTEGDGRTRTWLMLTCGARRFELAVTLDEVGKVRAAEAIDQSRCPAGP